MLHTYLKEHNIILESLPEIDKYCPFTIDENSTNQSIIIVLDKYKIEHKNKTIIEILYQINYRQDEWFDNRMAIDEDCETEFITDTIVYIEMDKLKQYMKKLMFWLFEDTLISENLKDELEKLTQYTPLQ